MFHTLQGVTLTKGDPLQIWQRLRPPTLPHQKVFALALSATPLAAAGAVEEALEVAISASSLEVTFEEVEIAAVDEVRQAGPAAAARTAPRQQQQQEWSIRSSQSLRHTRFRPLGRRPEEEVRRGLLVRTPLPERRGE